MGIALFLLFFQSGFVHSFLSQRTSFFINIQTMASKTAIQIDWESREFIAQITNNVKKLVGFLNNFDNSTRYRLAVISERLETLDRQMTYLEAPLAFKSIALLTATLVCQVASSPAR